MKQYYQILISSLRISVVVLVVFVLALIIGGAVSAVSNNVIAIISSLSFGMLACIILIAPNWWQTLDAIFRSADDNQPQPQVPEEQLTTSPTPDVPPAQPSSQAEEPSDTLERTSPTDQVVSNIRYSLGAFAVSIIAFIIIFIFLGGTDVNIFELQGNFFARDFQAVADGELFPPLLLQDEITHYFFARDSIEGFSLYPINLIGEPDQFVQLAIDEWGRPGNTLTYALASQFGIGGRRFLSIILLILTSAEAIAIARVLGKSDDGVPQGANLIFAYLLLPIMLWIQPWFFYYGSQSLTQIPFMYFLTAGVAAWLHGRYRRAAFFFSLLPITRHEALPLLFIWIIYLYRKQLYDFVQNLVLEIFHTEEVPPSDSQIYTESGKGIQRRWLHVLAILLPYLLWNLFSLAYRNHAPFFTLLGDQGNAAYETQNISLFFIAAQEWIGPFVFPFFLASATLAGMLAIIQYQKWHIKFLDDDSREDAREERYKFLTSPDVYEKPPVLSRYIWWSLYLAYFLIHAVIIALTGNRFASGGYDFFILPIAPAIAIIASRFIVWFVSDLFKSIAEFQFNLLRYVFSWFGIRFAVVMVILVPLFIAPLIRQVREGVDVLPFKQWLPDGGLVEIEIMRDDYPWLFEDGQENELVKLSPEFEAWLENSEISNFEIKKDSVKFSIPRHVGGRQAMSHFIATVNDTAEELEGWLNEPISERVSAYPSDYVPLIITTNPALRYALEQKGGGPPDDDGILVFNHETETKEDDIPFRLCPAKLWNVDPHISFFPNLFPDGTIIFLDGLPAVGITTAFMANDEEDNNTEKGYPLYIHHLSTAFNDYHPYFGDWQRRGAVGLINEDINPSISEEFPLFWINYGLVAYEMVETNIQQTMSMDSNAFFEHRRNYAERYCGYSNNERAAVVTAQHQPAFASFDNLFVDTTDTNDINMTLPPTSDNLMPVLDCPLTQAMEDISECQLSFVDVAYIAESENRLRTTSTPDIESALYVPPRSFLPVLHCQPIENRFELSWCLVVFADSAYAIDAESELSYTANTLNHFEDQDTANTDQDYSVCDFDRLEREVGILDERHVLPDVRNWSLLQKLEHPTAQYVDLIQRSDGTYVDDDDVPYALYVNHFPRGTSETSTAIMTPGCIGWVLAGRLGSNTLLIGEHLENPERDYHLTFDEVRPLLP